VAQLDAFGGDVAGAVSALKAQTEGVLAVMGCEDKLGQQNFTLA
jgi:hypothetical protein